MKKVNLGMTSAGIVKKGEVLDHWASCCSMEGEVSQETQWDSKSSYYSCEQDEETLKAFSAHYISQPNH
jgi:hypothetical protein